MQNAAITLRSLGSAFDDDAGGRAISHWLSSLPVEGCPCGADLSSAFGAPLLQGAALLACKNAICERNQYSPKYENTAPLTFPFTSLREPTSAPSGHLLPTEGGRVAIGEYPFFPPYRHFERMREIFFVRGQAKVGGQREAGSTVFLKTCNHGVSRKLIHVENRKRQTKKIPRLRSG